VYPRKSKDFIATAYVEYVIKEEEGIDGVVKLDEQLEDRRSNPNIDLPRLQQKA
jgi:hypothetical protein